MELERAAIVTYPGYGATGRGEALEIIIKAASYEHSKLEKLKSEIIHLVHKF